jgi:hypothetical protein
VELADAQDSGSGVSVPQGVENRGALEDSQSQLGAILGALGEHLADALDLTSLLAAWPDLPGPIEAGIAAIVEAPAKRV